MKRFWQIALSFVGFFLIVPLCIAQENNSADSLQIILSDSVQTDTLQRRATKPRPQPVVLQPLWYDLDGSVKTLNDTSVHTVFRFDQLLYQSYNGAADVFRNRPQVQVFDFLEMGLPRYIAPVNLLPHQSAVLMDGGSLNDPVSGMYNMRMLPLDAVRSVQQSPAAPLDRSGLYGLTQTAQFTTRYLNPEEPYTRLMFRQGDFGYTDLDITFARRINRRMAVQLGGINKYYDPNGYRGVNYRGSFSWQINPRVFWRTRFHLGDEGAQVYSRSRFPNYHYKETRSDVYSALTMQDADSMEGYWHLLLWYTSGKRRTNSDIDSFFVENKFKRFYGRLERHWRIDNMELTAGVSGSQNLVWGSAYARDYYDLGLAGWLHLRYVLFDQIFLEGRLRGDYMWGNQTWLSPQAVIRWKPDEKTDVRFSVSKTERTPNRSERSFGYYGIGGQPGLINENMYNAALRINYVFSSHLKMDGSWNFMRLANEIRFTDTGFTQTDTERSFQNFTAAVYSSFYKFKFAAGGLYSLANVDIAPQASLWAEVRYHDIWLNGTLTFDAVASYYWYGQRNALYYHPVIERFYWGQGTSPAYNIYTFKLMATVQDLQLYMAMDNPQAFSYRMINGYYEYYRRIRFGLNWVLWD